MPILLNMMQPVVVKAMVCTVSRKVIASHYHETTLSSHSTPMPVGMKAVITKNASIEFTMTR